jgi:phosphoribosylaminoimidazole-succinocarboxamide synthase
LKKFLPKTHFLPIIISHDFIYLPNFNINMAQTGMSTTNFEFIGTEQVYHGKVRDVYFLKSLIAMVVSDRISAFDHILPRPIPYKGQVLNQLALHFLESTRDIVPNWLIASPDPNVSIGIKSEPIRLEMVVRGYLAGHAWREYSLGKRLLCGVPLPDGLSNNDRLPQPIITPSTKAVEGHDEDISEAEILDRGIVSAEVWQQLCKYSLALFERGQKMANERGLILVDTKYEFGMHDGKVILIDEIHTPDSSRYFYLDGYEQRQANGEAQVQLSKEFVREWLMAHDFSGIEGQSMPQMPDEFVNEISEKYIQLYELITAKKFIKADNTEIESRILNNVNQYLSQHQA